MKPGSQINRMVLVKVPAAARDLLKVLAAQKRVTMGMLVDKLAREEAARAKKESRQ